MGYGLQHRVCLQGDYDDFDEDFDDDDDDDDGDDDYGMLTLACPTCYLQPKAEISKGFLKRDW